MNKEKKQPFYILLLLILSAELIFVLPFILPRIFRPTFLKVFELDNFELGTCFSAYGIVALISYFLGGFIADRFRPNFLIALSLVLTSLGAWFLISFPSYPYLVMIYSYWGFTTIFFFWATMIKATRVWGGSSRQGFAYGVLDGGRGVVAVGIGVLGIYLFASLLPDIGKGTLEQSREAFRPVIVTISLIIFSLGVFSYFGLKRAGERPSNKKRNKSNDGFIDLLKDPKIALLMLIVCSAYVGYKITGNYSLYANEILGYSEIESAKSGAFVLYVRPLVAIILGIVSFKFKSERLIVVAFCLSLLGSGIFATGLVQNVSHGMFLFSIGIGALGIYGTRALYFALIEQTGVSLTSTGTVVGLVSVIGFTPDIFVGPWTGYLLDHNPGILGHQYCFLILCVFSLVGLLALWLFNRLKSRA